MARRRRAIFTFGGLDMKKPTLSVGLCVALVVLAGCLWGTTGVFVRYLGAYGLSSMAIVAVRALLTTAFVTIGALCMDAKLLRIRLRDLWCFLGTGIASMMLFNICYFSNIEESGMAVAATMLYTAPVFVMILSAILFRERITPRKIVALILCVIGCVFVSGMLAGGETVLTPRSLLLGIGSGLGYGLYSIFTRYALQRGYHTVTITVYTFLFSMLGCLFFVNREDVDILATAGGGLWLLLAVYAVVTTVIPYLVYNIGLMRVENSKASVIASIEPVVAAVLGFAVFGELPTLSQTVGIVLVLAAVVMLNLKVKTTEQTNKAQT